MQNKSNYSINNQIIISRYIQKKKKEKWTKEQLKLLDKLMKEEINPDTGIFFLINFFKNFY